MEIPGYKIVRELGRGGMATVYLAVQESVSREVALKVMSPVLQADRTFGERFMREARIAANLHHRNVVAIHDVGVHDEFHYIAMEYLPGGELKTRLSSTPDPVQCLRIIREIADALNYAHSRGYVHRDVKPDNILFREDGSSVLTDFGIARATNSSTQMTRTGAVVGTPHYMSPEQARGKPIDHRADLYSLGIVFHEILTGSVPYDADDSLAVGIKHITEPVPSLPDRWAEYQPVLDKLLAKEPEARYQSGAELVRDLRAYEAIARTKAARTPPIDAPLPDLPDDEGSTRAMLTPADSFDRMLTPPGPTVRMATPAEATARMHTPADAPARMNTPPGPTVQMPTPQEQPTAAAASDGHGRREPVFGSVAGITMVDDFASPRRASPKRAAPGRRWPWILLALVVVAAAAGWWFQDPIRAGYADYQVTSLLGEVETALVSGRLMGAEGAVATVRRLNALAPADPRAESVTAAVVERLASAAQADQSSGRQVFAEQKIDLLATLDANHPLVAADQAPASPRKAGPGVLRTNPRAEIARLKQLAQEAEANDVWFSDDGQGAVDHYLAIRAISAGDADARLGLQRAIAAESAEVETAIANNDRSQADAGIARLARIDRGLAAEFKDALASRLEAEASQQRRRQTVERLLSQATGSIRAGRLAQPEGNNALASYQEVLAMEADNEAAIEGIENVIGRLLARAGDALEEDELEAAEADLVLVERLAPDNPNISRLRTRLARYRESNASAQLTPEQQLERQQWLEKAEQAMIAGDLMSPPGESAFDYYKAIFGLDRNDDAAMAGIAEVGKRLVNRARESLQSNNLNSARVDLSNARQTSGVETQVAELTSLLAAAYRAQVTSAIAAGQIDAAAEALAYASELQPQHTDLESLQLRLTMARE